MAQPTKWTQVADVAGDIIRRLRGAPAGVPLDVADDVVDGMRLAGLDADVLGRQAYTRPGDGREVPFDDNGWPTGREAWSDPARGMSPGLAAALRDAPAGDPAAAAVETYLRDRPNFSGIDIGPLDSAPDFELGSPLWHQLDKGWRANDNLRRGRTPNLRNQDPQLARVAGDAIRTKNADAASARAADAERADSIRGGLGELGAAAATVGVGAGLASLYPSGEKPAQGDLTDTSGTEELAAESRPVPATPAGPPDYSFQARELMNKLNAMRRKAGGEVPEAKAMMAEINRLLDLSNKQKNAPGYEPPMPTDYHGEAQRLLQKLNARRMEVGGEVPETPQVMAEVRRLQALGDQQRNAR